MLSTWKKINEKEEGKKHATKDTDIAPVAAAGTSKATEPIRLEASADRDDEDHWNEDFQRKLLSEKRMQVYDKLKNVFRENACADGIACAYAFSIESALNSDFPFSFNNKSYLMKALEFIFSLQKNKVMSIHRLVDFYLCLCSFTRCVSRSTTTDRQGCNHCW